MNDRQSSGDTTPLTEDQVLYYYDGPMILTLLEGDDLWMATCIDGTRGILNYAAVRVSREEVEAVMSGTMSLRGAFLGKPWRPMNLDAAGYAFKEGGGDVVPENYLAVAGVGLQHDWQGLPDQMPGAALPDENVAEPC